MRLSFAAARIASVRSHSSVSARALPLRLIDGALDGIAGELLDDLAFRRDDERGLAAARTGIETRNAPMMKPKMSSSRMRCRNLRTQSMPAPDARGKRRRWRAWQRTLPRPRRYDFLYEMR